MSWYLDSIRIYVEDDSGWIPQPRKGEIDLLDTNYTIIHTAGNRSYRRTITFVVFENYETSILPIAAKASVAFVDDSGTSTDVSVLSFSPERLYDYLGQKIFRVKAELIKDD